MAIGNSGRRSGGGDRSTLWSAAGGIGLISRDDFDGPLGSTRWYSGPKPDGGQWGGAHVVSKDEPQFSAVYHVQNGVLRIRAHHDLTYQDPEKWGWKEPGPKNPMPADQAWKPGRTWYSGQLALAFPDGHATASVRKGYFEIRAKLPATPGAWLAPLWLLNVPTIKAQRSSVEIDIEAYGAFPTHWNPSIHDWGPVKPHAYLRRSARRGYHDRFPRLRHSDHRDRGNLGVR